MHEKNLSPALMRLFGMIGFFGGGMLCAYILSRVVGTDQPLFETVLKDWSVCTWAIVIVSGAVGFICMIIGWGIAAQIDVPHPRIDYAISTIWHYWANYSLFWMLALPVVLTGLFGQQGAQSYIEREGVTTFFWKLATIVSSGSVLIAVICLITGILSLEKGSGRGLILLNVIGSLVMGKTAFAWLGIHLWWWIPLGILAGLLVPVFNLAMVARDIEQRNQICRG